MWVAFNAVVLGLLALDLGVFNREPHVVTMREAATWTGVWVTLALLFNAVIFFWAGPTKGLEFLAGYLIEYSLSVDNIFIFVLLFTFFRVPAKYQHRVLFWGIIGALLMRGTMIIAGAALIERFEWIIYVFGAFLIFTGVRMALNKEEEEEIHPEGNVLVRIFSRFMPVTKEYHGQHFFVKIDGVRHATPLFVVLLIVESTDLIFAIDSIPAIFAVTRDPFIVYTSNVCAILGLRSLYFLLAGVMDKFYYLRLGLAAILTFVGVKMLTPEISYLLTGEHYHIPIVFSLGVIVAILAIAVIASLIRSRRLEAALPSQAPQQPDVPEGDQGGSAQNPLDVR
ncbi:TerC family protein [Candidatus Gracilibacteria bacterium]|nr:TerC family protein [Candidatus Gracilibacteria bacterium]